MAKPGLVTRIRAGLLRTFRGRPRGTAAWEAELPVSAGAPENFALGELTLAVRPLGLKAAGENRPSIVYEVSLSGPGDPRGWSSSYGLPPASASARRAAEAALDELDEVGRDPAAWVARLTAGMSEDEAEAMLDSPAVKADQRAAGWVAPNLEPLRSQRARWGAWLG
ncbi:MAG: hypothetical protein ABR573_09780 [Candidatus Dormibacteria bacterium]